MDQYYSEWTEDVIAKMWLMEQICPPDSDDAKEFITTFSNGDFTSSYMPKDAVGNYIEHYIGLVLEKCEFPYVPHPNGTQAFPDYAVSGEWIEVKSFDASSSPAFDILTYDRLINDLEAGEQGTLYADYIVLGYHYNDNGSFYIESANLYKLWEIVNYNFDYNGQKHIQLTNRGVIRPRGDLRANDKTTLPSFNDEYEFIAALYQDILTNNSEYEAERWLANVQNRTLVNDYR